MGDANEFKAQRLLIIANHESFLDGLILGLFLPVSATFVVHTGVAKNPFFRVILKLTPYLAVDPTSPLAMRQVLRLLEQNKPVMIFPEGRITLTGSLMKVYDGPAFVAAKTNATIVPVRLDGPARSYFSRMTGNYPKKFLPKITLFIQPATHLAMPTGASARLRRQSSGEAMRRIMQEMVFASRPQQTLYLALLDAIAIYGRGEHVIEDLRQIEDTYGQILKACLGLGRLVSKFSEENEAIGIALPNLSTTLSLVLGVSAMGRVPAMLNYTSGKEGLSNACTLAKIRTVITSRKFLETAKLTATFETLAVRVVYLEDMRASFKWSDKFWLLTWALWFPRAVMHPQNPDQPALILFTSGSEGKPKGVVLSHRAILANIAQLRAVIEFSPADKFLNALPMFHAFGLTCGSLLPLFSGTKVFLYPNPLHYRVIPEVVYDRNCSVLFGTSTFLGNYAKFAHPYDFYRLRYVVAGAEKLNAEVRNVWMDKFGIRILEGYGATECAPVISSNTPMAYKPGSVGTFLPGIHYQLKTLPGIETGQELHVSGPNIMLGYYLFDQPGVLQAPNSIGPGWYNTGDIVTIDERGFITIVGRAKRFAKVAGEMVSLDVVEKIALAAAPAFQHAAIACADKNRGETILLFTTAPDLAREQLLQTAKKNGQPDLAVPREIIVRPALPQLGAGKIDYQTLKQHCHEFAS